MNLLAPLTGHFSSTICATNNRHCQNQLCLFWIIMNATLALLPEHFIFKVSQNAARSNVIILQNCCISTYFLWTGLNKSLMEEETSSGVKTIKFPWFPFLQTHNHTKLTDSLSIIPEQGSLCYTSIIKSNNQTQSILTTSRKNKTH